jgi:transcriptional regulator CtsR
MIIQMLEDKNEIEFQRNILAQDVGCVPSQINYVLSSRFTPERGYIVESRRGGGGCVRITRVTYDKNTLIMQVINGVGSYISESTANDHLINLMRHQLITARDASIISSALSDSNFKGLPIEIRDAVRACIFKQTLLTIIKQN